MSMSNINAKYPILNYSYNKNTYILNFKFYIKRSNLHYMFLRDEKIVELPMCSNREQN